MRNLIRPRARLICSLAFAFAFAGCNVILGIDEATYAEAASGSVGDGPAAGSAGAAAGEGGAGGAGGGGSGAPVAVKRLALGAFHSCALLDDRSVHCWGGNTYGQLGDGTLGERRLVPAPVLTAEGAPLRGVDQLELGNDYACALLEDSSMHCWGLDSSGQLGDGAEDDGRATPGPVVNIDGPGLLRGVQQFSLGDAHGCAAHGEGKALCWGANAFGQLGDGVKNDGATPKPTRVLAGDATPLTGVRAVAAGHGHSCALSEDATALCWGANYDGQAGIGKKGAVEFRPAPVVADASGAPLTDVRQLALGFTHSCALLEDGGVLCWGTNQRGQLGVGGVGESDPVPARVRVSANAFLSRAEHIALGNTSSCALAEGGRVFCWGNNSFGQLGRGGVSEGEPLAAEVLAGDGLPLRDVTQLAVGAEHACALLGDGSVHCWGYNKLGQLGNGEPSEQPNPVPLRVQGLTP